MHGSRPVGPEDRQGEPHGGKLYRLEGPESGCCGAKGLVVGARAQDFSGTGRTVSRESDVASAASPGTSDVREGVIGEVGPHGMPYPDAFAFEQPGCYRRPHRWQQAFVFLDEEHSVGEIDAVPLWALVFQPRPGLLAGAGPHKYSVGNRVVS